MTDDSRDDDRPTCGAKSNLLANLSKKLLATEYPEEPARFSQQTPPARPSKSLWNAPPIYSPLTSEHTNSTTAQAVIPSSQHNNQVSARNTGRQGSRQYQKILNVMDLMEAYYQVFFNESHQLVLFENATGKVLPAIVDVVIGPIKKNYLLQFHADISSGVVKSAFLTFLESQPKPTIMLPFYGRAGFDYNSKGRYLNTGNGCWFFLPSSPVCLFRNQYPYIAPQESLSFPLPPLFEQVDLNSSISRLFESTCLPADSDLLVIAWMILSWMADRQKVMLELIGDQTEAAKKTRFILKQILDPTHHFLEPQIPKTKKQIDEYAQRQYLLSFDRVEALSHTQKTELSGLLRGKRVAWRWDGKPTDIEFMIRCPIIINSLETLVTNSVLADSTLSIELQPDAAVSSTYHAIPTPAELISQTFPALLNLFGDIQSQLPVSDKANTPIRSDIFEKYGGLADLCQIGELVALSLGRSRYEFWNQFAANQQSRREYELDEHPVALAVKTCLQDSPEGMIEITVKDWLERLKQHIPPEQWPENPRGLAAQFKQCQGLLNEHGIALSSRGQRGPYRYWRAERLPQQQPL